LWIDWLENWNGHEAEAKGDCLMGVDLE